MLITQGIFGTMNVHIGCSIICCDIRNMRYRLTIPLGWSYIGSNLPNHSTYHPIVGGKNIELSINEDLSVALTSGLVGKSLPEEVKHSFVFKEDRREARSR
ncbi:MAG: hypothetical protein ACTSVW_05460 [Candidatus Njordarchaeales archaeon]